MITLSKLTIFNAYTGDVDSWIRHGKPGSEDGLTEEDWNVILALKQDLHLVVNNLADEGFAAHVMERLHQLAGEEGVVRQMMEEAKGGTQ